MKKAISQPTTNGVAMFNKIIGQDTEHSQLVSTNVSPRKEDELSGNHLSEIAAAISENIENFF